MEKKQIQSILFSETSFSCFFCKELNNLADSHPLGGVYAQETDVVKSNEAATLRRVADEERSRYRERQI